MNKILSYVIVVVLSALFLLVGNQVATHDAEPRYDEFAPTFYNARITEILEHNVDRFELSHGHYMTNITVKFIARITSGERRGHEVLAQYSHTDFLALPTIPLSVGNRVVLFYDDWDSVFHFAELIRTHFIILLAILFLALMIFFGRIKGINAVVSLGFIYMAVFFVFIPAILNERNIYITTVIVSAYAILSTLLIVIGVNKKALSAILGCVGGVMFAGILVAIMNAIMHLSGIMDSDTRTLMQMDVNINFRALIFAGVIIGAVGAIMDVAMSISSSLWELRESGGVSDFKSIFKSGINIGRDVIGTMLNTLILAYIGSSISLILLLMMHYTSFMELLNMEMIIVELLRALVGSMGMLISVPLTAAVCGWFYHTD